MKYQVFAPLALLQALNLFWYFLIWRIAARYALRPAIAISGTDEGTFARAVTDVGVSDVRSDDEDDGGNDDADDDKED